MDQLDQLMLEPQDLELLKSFQNLSPLLTAASEYKRAKEEEPQSKKSRLHDAAAGVAEPMHQAQAMPALTKMLIQLALQHERQLQALHRQDSFVFFAQLNKQGCVSLLTQKTQQWKDQLQKATDPTQQPKQTLRTFLLHALLTELQGRIVRLSKSKPGEELWDAAVQNGMIHQDGTWPFQKWNRDKQALETSHRQPVPMVRVLKDLEQLLELLMDSDHVVRFHALKPQQQVVPWLLQVHLRQDDLWRILSGWNQNSLWGMLGLSVKGHTQTLSKPAQVLQTALQPTSNKGNGKGKTKSNTNKSHR